MGILGYTQEKKEIPTAASKKKDYATLDDGLKLVYKSREVNRLRNRIQRYKHRLLKETFTKARDKDIKIIEYELILLDEIDDSCILIHKDYNGNVDIEPILNLVKQEFSSLYRRYHESIKRFDIEYDRLEEMVRNAS